MKIEEIFSKMSWNGFFPNLLGVVLGILLTFGGNILWQNSQDNKKTKEILVLLKIELERNKNWLAVLAKNQQEDTYVYNKILEAKGKWSSIPKDTLEHYRWVVIKFDQRELIADAWQIFQNSDVIQKMEDKELVVKLSSCYFWLNRIQDNYLNIYRKDKSKVGNYEQDPVKFFDAAMRNKESVFFFSMYSSSTDQLFFSELNTQFDRVLQELDEKIR